MAVQSKYIKFGGGLDQQTAVMSMNPGKLLAAKNLECKIEGGYARIQGYAKFDSDEVPGEGDILGVHIYNGKIYAFRNAVGGATAVMFESEGEGWTSKKTGLTPDGSYEFDSYNFSGTEKMYGVSGVHKAFEWDGTTWTDITTGMPDDTPDHIVGHQNHLFLAFGPSLQFSSLGDPTGTWSVVTGAGEILIGDGITGFAKVAGGSTGALLTFSRNSTSVLYGSSASDFVYSAMKEYGRKVGAIAGTIQQIGSRVKFIDDRGVMDFARSQDFGDFQDAVQSNLIKNIISTKRTEVVQSCVIRAKSQYRVFFSDGWGVAATLDGNKIQGWTEIYFPNPVKKVVSGEDSTGNELIVFGSTDGYIYQMESGDSFGGNNIEAYALTAFTNVGYLRRDKRFRRALFDMQATDATTIQVRPAYKFESIAGLTYKSLSIIGGRGGVLGTGVLGSFLLGASNINEGAIDIADVGDFIALHIYSDSLTDPVWEIDGVTYEFIPGRLRR